MLVEHMFFRVDAGVNFAAPSCLGRSSVICMFLFTQLGHLYSRRFTVLFLKTSPPFSANSTFEKSLRFCALPLETQTLGTPLCKDLVFLYLM